MSSLSTPSPQTATPALSSPQEAAATTAPVAHTLAVTQVGGLEQWKWTIAAAGCVLAIVLWMFWAWFSTQWRWAIEQQADWGHTLVIPIISGYFVYLNRAKLLAGPRPFRTTWPGLLPVVLGIAIYSISIGHPAVVHHNIQGFGIWVTICGLVLLFCGWRAMRWLWFPLVYFLVFGQTISENLMKRVTFEMQDITAKGAHLMLLPMVDVDRSGNTLNLFVNGEIKPLNIAEACSGMRMLMAFLALGVAMAYTGFQRYWQRAALVAMAVPTAIFVNILRVVTLGLLSLIDSGFAAGDFHSFIGLVWLAPAFFIFLGCMWIIKRLVIEEEVSS